MSREKGFGHTYGVRVQKVQRIQRVQRGRFLGLTGPMGRRVRKFDGLSGRGLWWRLRRKFYRLRHGTHLRCEGSHGSEGSEGSKGGGIALRAMSFIMPPSAVTSTSSIIIRITLVHPFATSWPSSPKGDARTLRDWLSVSYVTQYPVPPIFSFPLEVAKELDL